jgi:hypothetical protein
VIRLAALALLLAAAPLAAHDRSRSYSTWEIAGGRARVTLRLAALDATRLREAADHGALAAYAAARLELLAGGAPCAVTAGPRALAAAAGVRALEWEVACAAPGELAIRSGLLTEVAPGHLHFARVRRDGRLHEGALTERDPTWLVAPDAAAAGWGIVRWARVGVEHILAGWDHLAFLAALLLVGAQLGEVARIVTGFTVAHSATLALAAAGWVRPETASVEALIGLSVAVVAAENLWLAGGRAGGVPGAVVAALAALAAGAALGVGRVPALALGGLALFVACHFGLAARAARPAALRWGVAFVFGLLHGFGFAGVLVEAGLPAARLVPALLGFNAGVEAGQFAVVLAAWPVLRRCDGTLARWGSAAVLALGVCWFVGRGYG